MKLFELVNITENPIELKVVTEDNGRKKLKTISVKNNHLDDTKEYHNYNVSLIETKVSFDMSTINDEIKIKSTIICYLEKGA